MSIMSYAEHIRCVILGGGGHAHVLIDSLLASGVTEKCVVLDPNRSLWGENVLGVPVLGGDELLPDLVQQGAKYFLVGLGGVGNNQPRRRLFELGLAYGLTPLTVRHPSAICSQWVRVGGGSVLFPGAIVNAGASVGANVIINSGAVVEHHCVLNDHVHIATGARLSSTVHVGTLAHIGVGATVRQCIIIGEGAVVGAGAVVVKDVEPWTIVAGVPARLLKRREPDLYPSP